MSTSQKTTILSGPNCMACKMTKKRFDVLGIPYEEEMVDLNNTETREALKAQGFSSLPVVKSPIGDWCGMQPDKIKELAAALAGQ